MTKTICIGCGGELQNNDPSAPYYTPKDMTVSTLCQRCFRLRNYNEQYSNVLTADAYHKLIGQLASLNVLIVMVVDVFDLEGSMLGQIHKLTGNNEVLVLANKRDILPKSTNDQKLVHRIKKRLADSGITARDVILVSALKKVRIDEALDKMTRLSQGRDMYVVGATNVGKSTLINAFIKATSEYKESLITVSNHRGTTQGFIPIPFENQTLYDTPGLYNKNHVSELLTPEESTRVMPKKEIKPKTFQLKEPQTLFVSGLVRLDIYPKERSTVTVYTSDQTVLHRRKTEDSETFHQKHLGGLLNPPDKPLDQLFVKRDYNIKSIKRDIVIPGLAIITVNGFTKISLYLPQQLIAYEREALI